MYVGKRREENQLDATERFIAHEIVWQFPSSRTHSLLLCS